MEYNNLIRESNIAWLNEPWIYKEIAPYVHTANKNAGWNFNIKGAEKLQFTKYKLNQFYDWHVDAFDKPYKEMGELTGLIRKISVTCQLTDGAEYSGGELQFDFRNYDPDLRETLEHVHTAKEAKNKGTIIVFPSFVWHRVLPVTRGTRYSLVNWICGETFK